MRHARKGHMARIVVRNSLSYFILLRSSKVSGHNVPILSSYQLRERGIRFTGVTETFFLIAIVVQLCPILYWPLFGTQVFIGSVKGASLAMFSFRRVSFVLYLDHPRRGTSGRATLHPLPTSTKLDCCDSCPILESVKCGNGDGNAHINF
ncbi:hypothetical protein, unlikely [Trypanosoma congolense IL3000]|uniref:Uncharacterized protein n=1 Tax=Trypanosoma congolense (strain IL3000) TaxID=1068625 RepID=F9W620_TRYCI|nr:hypothetical protein, unlikely [Trypanosoma congolense IL3000]